MLKREEEITGAAAAKIGEYFPEGNAVLFDIETTGLSWRTSHLYLIGALFCQEGKWQMVQWFLDRPAEEKNMLLEFTAFLAELRRPSGLCQPDRDHPESKKKSVEDSRAGHETLLIHFNGEMFDLPYIRHKCGFYGIPDPFTGMGSFDIYRKVRPMQKILGLSSLKQKAVEDFIGIRRGDRYSGGELISVYQKYLQTGDRSLASLLFLHNHDDVIGMAEILPVLSYSGFFQGEFRLLSVTEKIYGEQKWICFSMKAGYPFPLPVEYTGEEAVLCLGQHADEPAQASLRLLSHHTQMKHFFPDYKNYYYFPAEDQAIHKDIAVYADAGHREKAKASNCYQRADGTFLPQMSEIFHPVFFREYRSKPMYFRWEDLKKICENSADDASGNDAGGAAGGNLLHTYLLEILQNLGKGML